MTSILIRCPQTLAEVPVGLETDAQTFAGLPQQFAPMHCPACGKVHHWSKGSAWLDGTKPASAKLELAH